MRKAIITSLVLGHCKCWEDQKRINKKQEMEMKAIREELQEMRRSLSAANYGVSRTERKYRELDKYYFDLYLKVASLKDLRGTVLATLVSCGILILYLSVSQ